MQKKIIALAVAGLMSGAVLAQSNVTIYGIVDVGFENGNSGYGNKSRVTSGIASGNRIGFRGEESLGGGMKASFVLENGFTTTNGQTSSNGSLTQSSAAAPGAANGANTGNLSGNSYMFQRQAVLGLEGGWGKVTAGRQYSPAFHLRCATDVSGCGLSATQALPLGSWTGYADRLDSSVYYWLPSTAVTGLTAAVGYSSGENNNTNDTVSNSTTDRKDGQTWGGVAMYNNGPIMVGAAYHQAKLFSTALAGGALAGGALGTAKGSLIAGAYDFGPAKLTAGFGRGKLNGNSVTAADNSIWSLGLSVPFGMHRVVVVTGAFNDKTATNGDWKHHGVGYFYSLSKRTELYGSIAKVNNSANGTRTLASSSNTDLSLINAGYDPKNWQVGVKHSF